MLLASGRASLLDASESRLAECGPGDPIGRLPRSLGHAEAVEVRASKPCRTLLLAPEVARRLEKNAPALMLRFYRYVVAHAAL